MKRYQKIIIWTFIVLVSIIALSAKVVEDPDHQGVPEGLTSSDNVSEIDMQAQIKVIPQNNTTGSITSYANGSSAAKVVTYLGVYPNETASCMKNTHLYDVFLTQKDRMITKEIAQRNAEQEAEFMAKKIAIELNYQKSHDFELKAVEIEKLLRQNDYKKSWYRWEIYDGPSKSGDEEKIAIYLNETAICENTTWILDVTGGEMETARTLTALNIRNIASQYNATEIINSTTLYSLDGSRYVFGPSQNGESGVGIYLKK